MDELDGWFTQYGGSFGDFFSQVASQNPAAGAADFIDFAPEGLQADIISTGDAITSGVSGVFSALPSEGDIITWVIVAIVILVLVLLVLGKLEAL